jgi:hypothetical protein
MNNKKNYSNTVIYKIICNDENIKDVYVGSTTNFKKRKLNHKSNCNNEKLAEHNYKVYKFIRNNGGWDNFSMIVVENFPCNNSLESHERERYYYDILNCTLNTVTPGRTRGEYVKEYYKENIEYYKEYNQKNKEKNKEYNKEYYEQNKDIIKEYSKKKYILNKEKIKENYIKNKEQILIKTKKYREENKDKIKEQRRLYRLKNKEKLRQQKLNT